MSIIKDSQSYIYGQESSFSLAHTCSGTNTSLLVGVSYVPNCDLLSVTYNGENLSKIGGARQGSDIAQEVWHLSNPSSGTNNIDVTFEQSTKAIVNGISYSGIKPTGSVYKSRSGVGKMVKELPVKSFAKISGISIGIGCTNSETSYVSQLSPSQTEEWNIIGSGLGIYCQAISAQLPVTLDEISVDNILTSPADWAIVIVGLEGA